MQPEGPYYLGGFCMGGQVAFEMAQRLVRDGEQVNLLFVIDTHNFNGVPPQFTLSEKVGNLETEDHISFLERPAAGHQKPDHLLCGKIEDRPAQRNGTVAHQDRPPLQAESAPRRGQGPAEEFIEDINDRAFLAYKPVSYPGKMTICKPRRNYAFLRDPFNGWGAVTAGGLEIIELPSDPGGIFLEPYVQTLAERLKEQIDQSASDPRRSS